MSNTQDSDEELTKEIGRLLELARQNPAFKMRSLKSQATKAIHTYIQDRDTKRDAYVIGEEVVHNVEAEKLVDRQTETSVADIVDHINGRIRRQYHRAKEWSDKS